MYRNHREAFQPKKGSKRAVETNLDNIINQAQIKMKEMIAEKMETDKKTNILIGQENVLNENISFLKNEINNKKQAISSMGKKVAEINEEIKNLEKENKRVIKEANVQEAKLKDDINGINYKLEKIRNGTIPAEASKVFELKKACDEVADLKAKNNKLRDRLYLLSRRLYSLEVRKILIYFYIFSLYRWIIVI
jgi:chromosome segregation ATPase